MWRRALGAALLGVLVATGTTACSDDTRSDVTGSPAPTSAGPAGAPPSTPPTQAPTETVDGALTEASIAGALLVVADLPDGFQQGGAEAGSAADTGCLTLIGRLDDLGAETSARVRFVAENEVGASGVLSKAYSDGDLVVLRQGLNRFAAAARACKSVDATDGDGARTRIRVTTDRQRTSAAAERQVNVTGTGTVAGAGRAYPYRIRYSVSLVGRTLAVVAGFEVGATSTDLLDGLPALGETVIDRLVAAGAEG